MKFVTTNLPYCALTIGPKDKYIEEAVNWKCFGIQINSHLNWKNHIDQMIPKLSAACYMVRQMYYICNNGILRSIYFAYFHCGARYGIIFWGNSSNSRKILTLQKRIIGIMVGVHHRTAYGGCTPQNCIWWVHATELRMVSAHPRTAYGRCTPQKAV
jgi:hypothetical protein